MSPAANSEKVASGIHNSPLPPSVEKAYYIKCVQLKRRIREIEEGNAAGYLRKRRVSQAIHKLQMQQALLLEHLQRLTEENIEGSDRSDSPPPTPPDKPLRSKRSHNRKSSPGGAESNPDQRPDKDTLTQQGGDGGAGASSSAAAAAGDSAVATPPSFAARPSSAVTTPDVQRTSYFGTPAGANGTPSARPVPSTADQAKQEEDTEMGEAPPPRGPGSEGASGGFTAVNRD